MTTESNAGVPPVLNAEQWAASAEGMHLLGAHIMAWSTDSLTTVTARPSSVTLKNSRADCGIGGGALAPVMALLNDALPADSPYRITQADADDALLAADTCGGEGETALAERLVRLASKLESLLRPV